MMTSTALMATSLALSAIGTAVGVASSIQQSQAQAAQQEYQSKIAQQNAKLAEQQASAQRMQGYEAMAAERLKTAKLIGQQRAQAGASGVSLDSGSILDVAEDTAATGEMNAINAFNQGIDSGYNSEIQAWNYESQAAGYDSAAGQARSSGLMSAVGQGIGGIADMGSTWAKFSNPAPTGGGKTQYWDRALNAYVDKPVRH